MNYTATASSYSCGTRCSIAIYVEMHGSITSQHISKHIYVLETAISTITENSILLPLLFSPSITKYYTITRFLYRSVCKSSDDCIVNDVNMYNRLIFMFNNHVGIFFYITKYTHKNILLIYILFHKNLIDFPLLTV